MPETAGPVVCGICGGEMQVIQRTTLKKFLTVFACDTGKPGARMPCDGYAYEISLKKA